ncbi:MAG: hypothetical protein NXI18_10350 [Alphaproteobacteria bacterium]|nr:hypothetical protein [Alphaproteobacteria bacterium]
MTDEQTETPTFWQRPVTRGVANGIVFAGLLMAMQVNGIFQEPRPLNQDLIVQDVFAGVIFGFMMYVIELWKRQRRINAEKAARLAVERRLENEADNEAERTSDDDRPRQ